MIISIGLRVDVTSPSILSLHTTSNRRQEVGHCLLIILLALSGIDYLSLHIRGMFHGVSHTGVKSPYLSLGFSYSLNSRMSCRRHLRRNLQAP